MKPTALLRNSTSLPVVSLVALTQAALGCGIGLLIVNKMQKSTRQTAAIALMSVGAATALFLTITGVTRKLNRPESERGMRKRLRSIREDSGFPSDAEIF